MALIDRGGLLGFGVAAGAVSIAGFASWRAFSATLEERRAPAHEGGEVIASPFGRIEFAEAGAGRRCL